MCSLVKFQSIVLYNLCIIIKKQLTTLQHFAILKLPKRGGQREHFLFMQRRMKLHRDYVAGIENVFLL